MYQIYKLFLLVLIFSTARSQILNIGECPQVDYVKDFDANKYLGKWYEIERYPIIWELLSKCVFALYTAGENNTVGVYNEQVTTIFHRHESINGTAYFDGPENEAKLKVIFPSFLGMNLKGAYWVLGTDYDNFAVVWSCTPLGYFHVVSSWILARDPKPSEEIIKKAYEVIDNNKINRFYYTRTDQNNCSE